MARRTKRRLGWLSGLGGSPAHHATTATSFFNKAITSFNSAQMEAMKGKCAAAYNDTLDGSLQYGQALAHFNESGGATGMRQEQTYEAAADSERKARKAYRLACAKPSSAGLGAMRRRRSRR